MLVHVLLWQVRLVAGAVHLEAVISKSAEAVATLRARAGRERGRVEKEVHLGVPVEVAHEDLLHIGQRARVARVAREARVGCVLRQLATSIVTTPIGALTIRAAINIFRAYSIIIRTVVADGGWRRPPHGRLEYKRPIVIVRDAFIVAATGHALAPKHAVAVACVWPVAWAQRYTRGVIPNFFT